MIKEKVLVVPRDRVLAPIGAAFFGISNQDLAVIETAISIEGFFMERALAEEDEHFKQIIPYFVYHYKNRLFLMQRSSSANEKRLASKLTLGIGGHIRSEDTQNTTSLFEWGLREFREEVEFTGLLQGELLGFINDDTNAVGRVHLGAVFLVHGDSANIAIRSELVAGNLMLFDECKEKLNQMESWSALVIKHLEHRFQEQGTLSGTLTEQCAGFTRAQI